MLRKLFFFFLLHESHCIDHTCVVFILCGSSYDLCCILYDPNAFCTGDTESVWPPAWILMCFRSLTSRAFAFIFWAIMLYYRLILFNTVINSSLIILSEFIIMEFGPPMSLF